MKNPLWTAQELSNITGGKITGDWQINDISIDSRTTEKGNLFVALTGDNFDGHDFIRDAAEKGAVAAIVSRPVETSIPVLMVEDTLEALTQIGIAGRARSKAIFIGITGSAGKTSTKEALGYILSQQKKTFFNPRSFNNHIGTPLTLARLPQDAEYAVLEMGTNHPGEIAFLTNMVNPDIGIITTIAPGHIEFFPTEQDIAREKSCIFDHAPELAILPADNAHIDLLKDEAQKRGVKNIITFGQQQSANTHLTEIKLHPGHSDLTATINGKTLKYKINAAGVHWALNSLCVLSVVDHLQLDLKKAAHDFANVKPTTRRGQQSLINFSKGTFTLIDDSYNSNPASVRTGIAVLSACQPKKSGRRIAVLGDMLELGQNGPQYHAELATPLAESGIDIVATCGALMKHLHENLPKNITRLHAENSATLCTQITDMLKDGDVILVKGSLGSKMILIIDALHHLETNNKQTATG